MSNANEIVMFITALFVTCSIAYATYAGFKDLKNPI